MCVNSHDFTSAVWTKGYNSIMVHSLSFFVCFLISVMLWSYILPCIWTSQSSGSYADLLDAVTKYNNISTINHETYGLWYCVHILVYEICIRQIYRREKGFGGVRVHTGLLE